MSSNRLEPARSSFFESRDYADMNAFLQSASSLRSSGELAPGRMPSSIAGVLPPNLSLSPVPSLLGASASPSPAPLAAAAAAAAVGPPSVSTTSGLSSASLLAPTEFSLRRSVGSGLASFLLGGSQDDFSMPVDREIARAVAATEPPPSTSASAATATATPTSTLVGAMLPPSSVPSASASSSHTSNSSTSNSSTSNSTSTSTANTSAPSSINAELLASATPFALKRISPAPRNLPVSSGSVPYFDASATTPSLGATSAGPSLGGRFAQPRPIYPATAVGSNSTMSSSLPVSGSSAVGPATAASVPYGTYASDSPLDAGVSSFGAGDMVTWPDKFANNHGQPDSGGQTIAPAPPASSSAALLAAAHQAATSNYGDATPAMPTIPGMSATTVIGSSNIGGFGGFGSSTGSGGSGFGGFGMGQGFGLGNDAALYPINQPTNPIYSQLDSRVRSDLGEYNALPPPPLDPRAAAMAAAAAATSATGGGRARRASAVRARTFAEAVATDADPDYDDDDETSYSGASAARYTVGSPSYSSSAMASPLPTSPTSVGVRKYQVHGDAMAVPVPVPRNTVRTNSAKFAAEQVAHVPLGLTPENVRIATEDGTLKRFMRCMACPDLFPDRESLVKHIDRAHPERFAHLRCSECNMLCPVGDMLQRHWLRRHCADKPFPCKVAGCDKSFVTRKERDNHSDRHSSRGRFSCAEPGCEQQYSTKASLDLHVRRVHRAKQYHCHLCTAEYAVHGDLSQHLRRKHNVDEDGSAVAPKKRVRARGN